MITISIKTLVLIIGTPVLLSLFIRLVDRSVRRFRKRKLIKRQEDTLRREKEIERQQQMNQQQQMIFERLDKALTPEWRPLVQMLHNYPMLKYKLFDQFIPKVPTTTSLSIDGMYRILCEMDCLSVLEKISMGEERQIMGYWSTCIDLLMPFVYNEIARQTSLKIPPEQIVLTFKTVSGNL